MALVLVLVLVVTVERLFEGPSFISVSANH